MIGKSLGKVFNTAQNLVMGVVTSKPVENVVRTGAKVIANSVEPGAGILDKGLKGAKKGVEAAVNKETYKKIGKATEEAAGKVIKNVITDSATREGTPYRQIGKTHAVAANRSLFGDEMHRRIQGGLDTVAYIAKGHNVANTRLGRAGNQLADQLEGTLGDKLTLGLPRKMIKGMSNINTGLITTGGDNLLPMGIKATKLGVGLAATAQLMAGTPQAVNQWNRNRQGTNYDSQPVTSAPSTPAYANNGGATGDLVFALNNLRHGGMM